MLARLHYIIIRKNEVFVYSLRPIYNKQEDKGRQKKLKNLIESSFFDKSQFVTHLKVGHG